MTAAGMVVAEANRLYCFKRDSSCEKNTPKGCVLNAQLIYLSSVKSKSDAEVGL